MALNFFTPTKKRRKRNALLQVPANHVLISRLRLPDEEEEVSESSWSYAYSMFRNIFHHDGSGMEGKSKGGPIIVGSFVLDPYLLMPEPFTPAMNKTKTLELRAAADGYKGGIDADIYMVNASKPPEARGPLATTINMELESRYRGVTMCPIIARIHDPATGSRTAFHLVANTRSLQQREDVWYNLRHDQCYVKIQIPRSFHGAIIMQMGEGSDVNSHIKLSQDVMNRCTVVREGECDLNVFVTSENPQRVQKTSVSSVTGGTQVAGQVEVAEGEGSVTGRESDTIEIIIGSGSIYIKYDDEGEVGRWGWFSKTSTKSKANRRDSTVKH